MKENPLSGLSPALLLLSLASLIYELTRGSLHVFSVVAAVAAVALFVLYRRESKHAASFLFWTTVPIYPLYLGLSAAGVYGRIHPPFTYVIMVAIWIGWIPFAWKLKKKYAAFVDASSPKAADAPEKA